MYLMRCAWILAICLLGNSIPSSALEPVPDQEALTWEEELAQIDSEIEELSKMKEGYEGLAALHEDQGMRWQFMQNEKQEARRAFMKAEEEREIAQMLQERIDDLKARRAQILREHPEANVKP